MDQPLAAAPAGFSEGRGGQVVNALVSLPTARPQYADAVHHHVDAVEHRVPGLGGQEVLETHAAARAVPGFTGQAPIQPPGVPAAYFHRDAPGEERGHGVATDEAAATDAGVRYLSRSWQVLDENCVPTAAWPAASAATANYVVYGNAAGSGVAQLPGLSADSVTVQALYGEVAGSEGPACIVRVTASTPFIGVFGERVVPFTRLGPIDLTTRREGRYIGE